MVLSLLNLKNHNETSKQYSFEFAVSQKTQRRSTIEKGRS